MISRFPCFLQIQTAPLPELPNAPESSEVLERDTKILLESKGFVQEPNDIEHTQHGFMGCVQGSEEMRRKVCNLSPLIFTPSSLIRYKAVNPQLYQAFMLKRLGHAFSLRNAQLREGVLKMKFEGFSEAFSIPMLASSLKVMKPQEFLSQTDLDWIFEKLKLAHIADRMETTHYESLSRALQEPNYADAKACGSGYDCHFNGWCVYGDYLIFLNKGKDSDSGQEFAVYYLSGI